jgi:hypothetical protein
MARCALTIDRGGISTEQGEQGTGGSRRVRILGLGWAEVDLASISGRLEGRQRYSSMYGYSTVKPADSSRALQRSVSAGGWPATPGAQGISDICDN